MKTLPRNIIPLSYRYYRSSTTLFYDYYKKYSSSLIQMIEGTQDFYFISRIFLWFYSISLIKIDFLLTPEYLKKFRISHGIIFWTPLRIIEKPIGWYKLPAWYNRLYIHSSRSSFCILDTAEYWKKWSSSARNHRKHILTQKENGKIVIETSRDIEKFLALYQQTKISDPNKWIVSRMTRKLLQNTMSSYRTYFISVDWKILAGAVFIDDGDISEYWASFYHRDARMYHLGIAMMDAWIGDSFSLGIKICDLDHMRDKGQLRSFAGYTKFKESIADFDVYFHDTWVKVF